MKRLILRRKDKSQACCWCKVTRGQIHKNALGRDDRTQKSRFSTTNKSIIQAFLSIRPQELFFLSMGIKCVIPQEREAAVCSRRKTYCVIHYLNHDTRRKYRLTRRCSCEANYGSNRGDLRNLQSHKCNLIICLEALWEEQSAAKCEKPELYMTKLQVLDFHPEDLFIYYMMLNMLTCKSLLFLHWCMRYSFFFAKMF